jgi:hypothetical protein
MHFKKLQTLLARSDPDTILINADNYAEFYVDLAAD